MSEDIYQMFGNIQVSNLGNSLSEENVGGFDISVDDVALMQSIQPFQWLVGYLPDDFLWDSCLGQQGFFDAVLS